MFLNCAHAGKQLTYLQRWRFHFLIISTESRLAEGWIARKSSLYKISSEKRTWEDSRESCQNMGADLVIVNDLDEQVRWLTC